MGSTIAWLYMSGPMRLLISAVILAIFGSTTQAASPVTLQRKQIMVSLGQYTRYLAGLFNPKNPIHLEKEFACCANVIDDYQDSTR